MIGVFCFVTTQAKVVINEVFYHAPNDIENLQWIELYNGADEGVDLSGWSFSKGIRLTFTNGTHLGPRDYLVICRDRQRFEAHYKVPVAAEFQKLLKRKGERLELVNQAGVVVDELKFEDRIPWPISADGFSSSMERISPESPSRLPENWASSTLRAHPDEPGGTPGRINDSYSKNLPPIVRQVSWNPASPGSGNAVLVEASVDDSDGIGEVTVAYEVFESGKTPTTGKVILKPGAENRFSGTVPGQPSDRLVRFRFLATDAKGTLRTYPGPNEPRPALSYWVRGTAVASQLAVAQLIHLDEQESVHSRRRLAANGRQEMDETAQLRWQIQNLARSNLDPSQLWCTLVLKGESSVEQVAKLSPLFNQLLSERDALIRTRQASNDLSVALQGTFMAATAIKQRYQAQLSPTLQPSQIADLEQWVRGGSPRTSDSSMQTQLRMRGEMMLRQLERPEPGMQALTSGSDLTTELLKSAQSAYREYLAQRDGLLEIAGSVRDAESYEKVNETVRGVNERLASRLKSVLSSEQTSKMQRASEDDRASLSFGRGRGGGPTMSSVVQGRSALIWHEPGSKDPKLFDFVTIADRKAGYKVRLQRDRPLNGMTGLNLIFEEDERMVLAEPLALEFYRLAGLPASRTDFIQVIMDGKRLGYHLLIEQPNTAFLKRHGLSGDGDIFKFLWFERGIARQHEKKNNPHRGHDALIALINQLNATSGAEQWLLIKKHFDVEQVINYFAVNMLLSHWDGFMNNFFAYHDHSGSGKWMLFPWDQDKTWGTYDGIPEGEVFSTLPLTYGQAGDAPPGWSKSKPPRNFFETMNTRGWEWWRPPGCFSGPLLSNAVFRKHFLSRVKELLETHFTEDRVDGLVETLRTRLEQEVSLRAKLRDEDTEEAMIRFKKNLSSFQKLVRDRRAYLLKQEDLKVVGAYDRTLLK